MRCSVPAFVLGLALVVAAPAAWADIAPPPGYVERCTVPIMVADRGGTCVACRTGRVGGQPPCAEQMNTATHERACRTGGASVWTEVWCSRDRTVEHVASSDELRQARRVEAAAQASALAGAQAGQQAEHAAAAAEAEIAALIAGGTPPPPGEGGTLRALREGGGDAMGTVLGALEGSGAGGTTHGVAADGEAQLAQLVPGGEATEGSGAAAAAEVSPAVTGTSRAAVAEAQAATGDSDDEKEEKTFLGCAAVRSPAGGMSLLGLLLLAWRRRVSAPQEEATTRA